MRGKRLNIHLSAQGNLRQVSFKLFDYVAIVLTLIIIGSYSIQGYSRTDRILNVNIQSPEGEWIFPLSSDLVFTGTGYNGTCLISINSDGVQVIESDCPNKICIQMGRISRSGQWIACLPHRIFIRIDGREETNVDALSS